MSKQSIECLFFDLGNVLVNVHLAKLYENFAVLSDIPVENIPDILEKITIKYLLFQQGKIPKRFYLDSINDLFETPIKDDDIERAYCEIFSLNKDVLGLIKRLNGRYNYSIISNTDELHYEYILEEFPELELFRNNTTSFEARSLKPDSIIYKKALKNNGVESDKCLFVDDLKENVLGAELLGINSIQFVSANQLEKDLKELKILN